jgi:hypothetical protein
MDSKPEKPLRVFVNPFAVWTHLAFKTGEAIWASAHAAAVRANAPRVAVIPATEVPPRRAETPVAPRAPKAARHKARAKVRSKAKGKRSAKR